MPIVLGALGFIAFVFMVVFVTRHRPTMRSWVLFSIAAVVLVVVVNFFLAVFLGGD